MENAETVKDLQNKFNDIYGVANKNVSVSEILNRLDESAGYLGKNIKRDNDNLERWLIKSLSWLFALANKLNIDLEDATLKKFPGYCHYCLETRCICEETSKLPRTKQDRKKELDWHYNTIKNQIMLKGLKPNLDYFNKLLASIYPINITNWRHDKFEIIAKLAEERAEIIEAFRRYNVNNSPENFQALSTELADYFAWLIGIWFLIFRTVENYSIQEAMVDQYRFGCPYCKNAKCNCPIEIRVGLRSDSQIDFEFPYEADKEKELEKQLSKLISELEAIANKPESSKIVKDIKDADIPKTKEGLIEKLGYLQSIISKVCQSSEDAAKIAHKIKSLVEWVTMYWQ